jgi:hypothetical protein
VAQLITSREVFVRHGPNLARTVPATYKYPAFGGVLEPVEQCQMLNGRKPEK